MKYGFQGEKSIWNLTDVFRANKSFEHCVLSGKNLVYKSYFSLESLFPFVLKSFFFKLTILFCL